MPKKLTKQELEEQQKAAEAAKKEAKKKEGGLLGFLMQKAGSSGNVEKGGLEFSLANLFKCMCFTHEDPDANPQKQLVKIAASIEDINTKLKKIENTVRGKLFCPELSSLNSIITANCQKSDIIF